MRCAVIAAILATPAVAVAGHRHCSETSTVVGYQQCSRFGAGWAGATLGWELGLTVQSFRFEAVDRDVDVARAGQTTAYHVTSTAEPGAATALTLRNLYNLTEHVHVATELAFGHLVDEPRLAIGPVAREMTPMETTSRGWLFGGLLAVGVHASPLGSVTVGTEIGFGPRMIVFETAQLPGTLFGQGGPALEARVHAALWVSPHWTIGALVSTNVLAADEHSLTLALGLHAFPYDGGR